MKFKIKLKGITPYMQHRMDDSSLEQWEKQRGKIIERPEVSLEDLKRAEFHCYRDKDGKCYVPSDHLRGSMINAGAYLKSKVGNSRKSMKNIVAAMFLIEEEKIFIKDFDEVDKRSAVNRNVKARIITIRPKWTKWDISFTLSINNHSITEETIKDIINHAGDYCGIGSYRPTNNGMFGRFELKEIKKIA